MMEKLLETAAKSADAAAVYATDSVSDKVQFDNGKFKGIESGMQSGVSLLMLKGGRLGSAYTRNLIDPDGLAGNALAALKGGVEAGYELPLTRDLPQLNTYDEKIERLTNSAMVEECGRVCAWLSERAGTQIDAIAVRSTASVRLLNTSGTDLKTRTSAYFLLVSALYPGSYAAISRVLSAKSFKPLPDADLEFIAGLFNASKREAKPAGGPMRVLFLPHSVYALVWRLTEATSGKAVYEKVSPLKDKVGQRVLSDKLTLVDEPLNDALPGARAFDDEGTACHNTTLFEAGVLRGFYNDLYYAWKNGVQPTGHGYRADVTSKAVPSLEHLRIEPGPASIPEMVKQMERGVIVAGVMGAHSGNILNGDYSLGLSPGLWVENGEITGQVKDAMVAGNVYETMTNVVAVGDKAHDSPMGRFPAVLFDGVSVATKG
jgi:PmbA protein